MALARQTRSVPVRDALWQGLRQLNRALARGASALVVVLVAVMVLSIVVQIVTRVILSRSPPWTEEVALLMFTWIVLLMTAVCTREHMHVRVDVLSRLLPRVARSVLEACISLLVAAVSSYLVWAGSSYLIEMSGSTSHAIGYPSELLYAGLPLSSVLMLLFGIENAVAALAPAGPLP